jgi:hypothetical protein
MHRSKRTLARIVATTGLLLVLFVPASFHNLPPAQAAEAKTTSSISLPGHQIRLPGPVRIAQ